MNTLAVLLVFRKVVVRLSAPEPRLAPPAAQARDVPATSVPDGACGKFRLIRNGCRTVNGTENEHQRAIGSPPFSNTRSDRFASRVRADDRSRGARDRLAA